MEQIAKYYFISYVIDGKIENTVVETEDLGPNSFDIKTVEKLLNMQEQYKDAFNHYAKIINFININKEAFDTFNR